MAEPKMTGISSQKVGDIARKSIKKGMEMRMLSHRYMNFRILRGIEGKKPGRQD